MDVSVHERLSILSCIPDTFSRSLTDDKNRKPRVACKPQVNCILVIITTEEWFVSCRIYQQFFICLNNKTAGYEINNWV
jgi:hypothetical protein